MAVTPARNTNTSTTNSSMLERIPAWKRLGLKLKNAKETQGGNVGPTNGASPKELKRSLPDTHLALAPEPQESCVKLVTKRRRLGSAPTESAQSNGSLNRTSNIFSTSQSARLKKKVSFTAETKLEDGGKELITDWEHDDYAYYEQKAADNDAKEALRVASDARNEPHKSSTHPQKASDTGRKSKDALEYLNSYCTSRRSWKFNKNREVWILRHILSSDDIPTSFNIALASYVHGLGSQQARLRLLNQCQEALDKEVPEEPSKGETGSNSGHMEDPIRRKAYHYDAIKRFKQNLEGHLDYEQRKADEDDPDYQRWLSRRRRAELLLWAITPSTPSTEGASISSQEVRSEPHSSTSAKSANGVLPSGHISKKKNRTAVIEVSSSSEDESGSSGDDDEDGDKVGKENGVLNGFTQFSTSAHKFSDEASGSNNDSNSDSDSSTAAGRSTSSSDEIRSAREATHQHSLYRPRQMRPPARLPRWMKTRKRKTVTATDDYIPRMREQVEGREHQVITVRIPVSMDEDTLPQENFRGVHLSQDDLRDESQQNKAEKVSNKYITNRLLHFIRVLSSVDISDNPGCQMTAAKAKTRPTRLERAARTTTHALRKQILHHLPRYTCHAKAAATINQASGMGDKSNRVEGTLKSLFESLIPSQFPGEDDEAADERIDRSIEIGRNIVDAGSGYTPPDVNQAQDLIKRKLLRENASPEKAARFSNLYSRLLSIPVLNQKWSILYLLYKLSEQDAPAEHSRRPLVESDQLENVMHTEQTTRRKEPKQFESRRLNLEASRSVSEKITQSNPSKVRPQRATSSPQPHAQERYDVNGASGDEDKEKESVPSETALLRDLPFNLQGLSSAHFIFTSATSVKLPADVPIPVLSLLNALAEPCLLYRGLSDFIQSSGGGLVGQSLRAAIGTELRSYLSLVATLEGEIRRALAAIEKQDEKRGIREAGVTLKRCVIWTRDATMGLRLMSLVVEESKQQRGGQLISLIHGFSSSHGDPFVGTFAERLLAYVTRPFYDMLRRWIYDGELIDPYHEFFVTEPDSSSKPDIDPRRVATSVWDHKYQLDNAMVPSIISAEFAKKIFLIGKSLNFIRHNCGDSDWVIEYSKSASKELHYGDTAGLEASIDEAYKSTMSRLIHLMSEKYNLFIHLKAIKRYLLLSQGDFIALLMESLAPNLDRPANSQYRHTLTSQLEHAIRHSNAQYDDAEVLSRLDARMIEFSSGDTGWECFTLEYKISPPCDVVITQWASTQYLKVFNLLWRIKRVEFSLSSTWRRCMTGSRGVLAAVEDKVGADWKRARCVIAEMVHFVNQLQYYILFEVVEASWDQLETAMNKPDSTLDELIEAHTKYLNNITHKGLLGSQRHHSTGQREDSFLTQLYYILKNMLAYKDVVDGLYSFSVAEFTRRQEFSAKIEHRTAQGKWGITEKDLVSESSRAGTPTSAPGSKAPKHNAFASDEIDSSFGAPVGLTSGGDDKTLLASLRARLIQLSADFKSKVNVLLYDIGHQPDVDMRFLGVVMNFNEVYKPVNIRRQAARKEREKKELERKSREASAITVEDGNESKRSER